MRLVYLLIASVLCYTGFGQSFVRTIDNDSSEQTVAAFQNNSGDYIILSNTYTSNGEDLKVTKTNGLGVTQWAYTYGTSDKDIATNMRPTSDGGSVICGYSDGISSLSGYESSFIIKLNSSGTVQWSNFVQTDSINRAFDVMQAKDGSFYMTGVSEQDTMEDNMLVVRYNSFGSLSWVRSLGGDGNDVGHSLTQDILNRIVIVGSTTNDSVNIGSTGDMDAMLYILTAGGNVVSSKNIGTNSDDEAMLIKSLSNGNLYIVGNTLGAGTGGSDIFATTLDTNLTVQATGWYGTVRDDYVKDFKIRQNGNIVLSFSGGTSFSNSDASIVEISTNGVGFNTIYGGFQLDGTGGVPLTGQDILGYSVVSSGRSVGNTTTDAIQIFKMLSNFTTNCQSLQENMDLGTLSLSSGVFSNVNSLGTSGTYVITRTSTTNSDSTFCCQLNARINQDSLTVCQGESVNLGKQNYSGYQYSWTSLSGDVFTSSAANPLVAPTQSTLFKLVVSSADNMCTSDSATVYVKVNQRQTLSPLTDSTLCTKDSIIINGAANMSSYEWKTAGGTFISSSSSIKLFNTDTVSLRQVDAVSCIYHDTVAINFLPLPSVNLGADTTICENLELTLQGPTGMTTYTWNGTATTSSTYTTNVSQMHILKVTDANGCENADSITVLTNPSSVLDLGEDTTICEGSTVSLFIPTSLNNYSWNNQATTNPEFQTSAAGTYVASADNSFGCPAYDTIEVSLRSLPEFSLGADTGFCDVVSLQLRGPSAMSEYLWNDNSENITLNVQAEGSYWLTVIDMFECSFTDTIAVSKYTSPTIDLGVDTIIPLSGVLVLTPGSDFATYDWSTGETTSSIQVSDTGTYSVTVTDDNGCSGFAEIRIPKTASIRYLNGVQYTLYPNPANNQLRIATSASIANAEVKIMDAQGRIVLKDNILGANAAIDVSTLSTGIYRLLLTQDNNTLSFNVIIRH